jgi:uncharacterized protein YkwD
VLRLVNVERAKAGCQPLVANSLLNGTARAHSTDMAVRNFFSHTNPDGKSPFDRMRAGRLPGPHDGREHRRRLHDAASVMTAWMNSSGHRANILNCGYKEIGVGYYAGGSYRHYWTQNFGTR